MSLLSDAKKHKPKGEHTKFSRQDEALVNAWLHRDITLTQLIRVKQFHSSKAYAYIARVARQILSGV